MSEYFDYKCRWLSGGNCMLNGEQCGGYDPNDCVVAEDFYNSEQEQEHDLG